MNTLRLLKIYLFLLIPTLDAAVYEYQQTAPPLGASSIDTIGKVGKNLTNNITKILKKITAENPNLSDSFGQLEAMYILNFDSKLSLSTSCFLYKKQPNKNYHTTPKLKLITSGSVNIADINALKIYNKGIQTYFFKSDNNKIVRVKLNSHGAADITYYQVKDEDYNLNTPEQNYKKEKPNHLKNIETNRSKSVAQFINPLFIKNKIKANEVVLKGQQAKVGIYSDQDFSDANVKVKMGAIEHNDSSISHTHTKYVGKNYKTVGTVPLSKETTIKLTHGNRLIDPKRLYAKDHNLQNENHNTVQKIEEQKANEEGKQYYSTEIFHRFNSNNKASILFEESRDKQNDKRQVLGLRYSYRPTENLEAIIVMEGEIENEQIVDKSLKSKVGGWIEVKYSF